MGSTFHTSISLLVVLFLMIILPHCQSNETQDTIDRICSQTADYFYCRDVFNEYLYTPNVDIKGLTQIALSQTLINATNTYIFIKKSETNEKRPNVLNLYKICESGYNILENQYVNAQFAFGKNDFSGAAFQIKSTDRFVNDCQNVLGSTVPELARQNKQNSVLVKMSIVCLNILLERKLHH